MNRPMLAVVAVLVIVGFAVFALSGPSMIDRIEAAESCEDLGRLSIELRQEVGDALNRELQRKAIALGC